MATSVVRTRLAATASVLALTIAAPALAQTAPDGGATAVDDIIVTAQKREESIQDVPIAVSAFSAETLDAMKIEGGSELMRAIPNVSFSKGNFSMYNFSIRGIGTKAISASSDPAVAVSFNNTPLIRNRLFEQEYLDVNRVEVLRGPQGTLYGRNATAGVVNMIPNLPGPDFDAMLKAEAGNYGSVRGQMMVNIPITDTFWVRAAASMTKREGFDHNTFLDTKVNGRDLYSTRLSAAWEPSDRFNANLIWEHFGEDDNRSRTGKQLCTRDPGPTRVGAQAVPNSITQNRLSQGCLPGGLYGDAAYGTPNGGSFAHWYQASQIIIGTLQSVPGFGANSTLTAVDGTKDPYQGVVQSKSLREIATSYDPKFRASNDVVQLNLEYELSEGVTFYSQTAYSKDDYFSTQDYSRFVSNPIFADSTVPLRRVNKPLPTNYTSPGGYYNDPQLGRSNRLLSADLSQSDNSQFTQEFRASSNFDGVFNFNIGANYLDFKTEDNYYVFNNLFSYIAEYFYNRDNNLTVLSTIGFATIQCDASSPANKECVYVDYSRISNLAGDGHNYFRSRNLVNTRSYGVFGEAYWEVAPSLRLTAGLRYTDDTKETTPIPSQLLLGASMSGVPGLMSGGYVNRGYPEGKKVKQSWQAVTGRFVADWKPDLALTDDTLIYASYSRGYKGGGMNPPRVDINPLVIQYLPLAESFEPEYLNAFELGTKNTLYDGRVRFNATAFYYDYQDYQVSQIVDRISLNENFDATIWGAEFEFSANITRAWRIDANIGYLKTKIADGEKSIDVMDRTQGNKDWMILRPWLQVPSNCIAPVKHVETVIAQSLPEQAMLYFQALCGGSARYGSFSEDYPSMLENWKKFNFQYDPFKDAPNFGRGFDADLGGNELPNSPRWTANIGTQYTISTGGWDTTLRADYYWQDNSYFRIYNTNHDVIRSWDNVNLSITVENIEENISVQAYVKNALDDAPITDAFINSDDTGLTTNVFTLDPRFYGFSVTKRF